MQSHFPVYFSDENEAWRKWATENIESLGGAKWESKKLSGPIRPLRKVARESLNTSSKLLPEETSPEDRSERVEDMKKIVVIDAGHGGNDPGAIGVTRKKEKDFNLTIAHLVADLLKINPNFKVYMTRDTDVFVDLSKRAKFANNLNADAFVSIHANNAGTATAGGYETWFTRDASAKFATTMHKKVLPVTGFKDRGVQSKSLAVCRETKMPAILLEAGFLSNPNEEKQLFNAEWQDKYAKAIYDGICEYLGVSDQPEKTNSPYPEMTVTVDNQPFTGYNINNITWIPSRPVGEMLGGTIGYVKGKVTINGTAVDTKLINGVGFVTARDLTEQLGARIYWDKSNPYNVFIYPKL
ncbi:hypothetical protein MAM1_0453c10585 [Mucor ambiguus]|uniref:MurNAc-LAA domain-containing protein n=1 Tax=Mucor ambiguus TaxID=91626 RepID=A0A0C9N8M1_9FUNG|nr:hypothetical protein MAM1_0453c10585 [Mucor ambiguus]